VHRKQLVSTADVAESLNKDLNIPVLLSKRPAFPLSFIEKTIDAGLDPNEVDKNLDETLLMYASRTGNLKLAQLMVKKRAIIDQTNVKIP
jgi:ankyrin repeat protein